MGIPFFKYQATGNDFVIIDDRSNTFDTNDHELIQLMCDRRFGIGADGLMLFRNHNEYDFEMVYFNADGYEGSMCGNGGRSIVKFGFDQGFIGKKVTFKAYDGPHEAEVLDKDWIRLEMRDVDTVEVNPDHYWLDTGSPHYVRFVKDIDELNVLQEGRTVRYNDRFKEKGTNVNFVEEITNNTLKVRTYERGVENETLSCGTGVTASALAFASQQGISPVNIVTLGGDLRVEFDKLGDKFSGIYLSGPASMVFVGTFQK